MDQKEEINIQPEQNEEARIQKNERIRRFWDISKSANIQIIRMPEGEEEEKEIETLLEKIMKENFFKCSKRKEDSYLQRSSRNTISQLFKRNFAG